MHATRFAALGDATRFRLVEMLSARALPVHVLTAAFSISRPAISRHLRVLKEAGVVIEEKSGRENLYKLQPQHLVPLTQWLAGIEAPAASSAVAAEKAAPVPKPRKARSAPKPKPEISIQPDIIAPPTKPKAPKPTPKPPAVPAQNQMAWEF